NRHAQMLAKETYRSRHPCLPTPPPAWRSLTTLQVANVVTRLVGWSARAWLRNSRHRGRVAAAPRAAAIDLRRPFAKLRLRQRVQPCAQRVDRRLGERGNLRIRQRLVTEPIERRHRRFDHRRKLLARTRRKPCGKAVDLVQLLARLLQFRQSSACGRG